MGTFCFELIARDVFKDIHNVISPCPKSTSTPGTCGTFAAHLSDCILRDMYRKPFGSQLFLIMYTSISTTELFIVKGDWGMKAQDSSYI